jgi:hypothetical protein
MEIKSAREVAEEIVQYFNARVDIPFRYDDPGHETIAAIIDRERMHYVRMLEAVYEADSTTELDQNYEGDMWIFGGMKVGYYNGKTLREAIEAAHKSLEDES